MRKGIATGSASVSTGAPSAPRRCGVPRARIKDETGQATECRSRALPRYRRLPAGPDGTNGAKHAVHHRRHARESQDAARRTAETGRRRLRARSPAHPEGYRKQSPPTRAMSAVSSTRCRTSSMISPSRCRRPLSTTCGRPHTSRPARRRWQLSGLSRSGTVPKIGPQCGLPHEVHRSPAGLLRFPSPALGAPVDNKSHRKRVRHHPPPHHMHQRFAVAENPKLIVRTLFREAATTWRNLNGPNRLPSVFEGVTFTDGFARRDTTETRAPRPNRVTHVQQ